MANATRKWLFNDLAAPTPRLTRTYEWQSPDVWQPII